MTRDDLHRLFSSPYILAFTLLFLALAVRMIGIGDAPLRTDEIYHLLAGRSWAEHGTLAMGDGVYTRAKYYSIATGWFFKLFGTTPGVGRALAAVGGVALVVVTALWTRSVAGPVAGWVAGLLICFDYSSISLSQFARFYTWHALAVFVLAAALYTIVTQYKHLTRAQLACWSTAAIVALICAVHLQPITALVAVALASWTGIYLLLFGPLRFLLRSPRLLGLLLLAGAALAAGIVIFEHRLLLKLWGDLRQAAAWSEGNRDDYAYYITMLNHVLGWLFFLFPLAAILAGRRYLQPTLFCVVILAVCLGIHSLAGMKALRYVFYLFPFIFAVWAMAAAAIGPWLVRLVAGFVPSASPGRRSSLAALAIMILLTTALLLITDFRLTAAAAARLARTGSPELPFEYGAAREQVDWTPHLPLLRSLVGKRLFVATDSVRTLYYLRDYDVILGKSELSDVGDQEFTYDKRTGKRDISTGQSLARIVNCYADGIILVSNARWRTANVTDEAADTVERLTKPVALPPDLNMQAHVWHGRPANSADCQTIHKLIGELGR